MSFEIELPQLYTFNKVTEKNFVRQLYAPPQKVRVSIEKYSENSFTGEIIKFKDGDIEEQILVTKSVNHPVSFSKVIITDSGTQAKDINEYNSKWLKHPKYNNKNKPNLDEVLNSWTKSFSYLEENEQENQPGLRKPQLGALHAIKSHWTVSNTIGTVVMPTGTGKTEVMLSLLISHKCKKILVITPTDALRTQIYNKFLTLGILKKNGVVAEEAQYPVVGMLRQKPHTVSEIEDLLQSCNVVVTTMSIAGQCDIEIQKTMASYCTFLFIDEAHHTGAATWKNFKDVFKDNIILQFTATPFRNDNQTVSGEIIYKYPLKLAQKNGYFKKINFVPVRVYDTTRADEAIADKAIEQLKNDPTDHILMARVNTVKRADEVYKIYKKYSEFNPVRIDSSIKNRDRALIREQIINKKTKIIVCVDMLGEGFDLPELKIAAFHDIKKSLPVTLQLAGRFTRKKPNLGEATFIANIANVEVRDELKQLYREDPDWNVLLEQSSEKTIEQQVDLQNFIDGFSDFPDSIPLQNLKPAMSTVIYRTRCENWNPENFKEGLKSIGKLEKLIPAINNTTNTLVLVTAKKVPIKWAKLKDIYNWDWELYVVFWDKKQKLLFIHGSNNLSYFKNLAEAVAGEVTLIRGGDVFRCFSGVNRLKLNNVGLREQFGKLIKYIMRAGADIEAGLTEAQKRHVTKSLIIGTGYEDGEKTSIGCSYKGRIWSHRVANVHSLVGWCSKVGAKVVDSQINADDVLKGTLIPKMVSSRPNAMPIGIDWPEVVYSETEDKFSIRFDSDNETPLFLINIDLKDPAVDGNIKFSLISENGEAEITLVLKEDNSYEFEIAGEKRPKISFRNELTLLKEFLENNPPVIWFADGSSLEGNFYTRMNHTPTPYLKEKIEVWNWPSNVDITNESQGLNKDKTSIQYHAIENLKNKNYNIIFDDDAKGEAADIITVNVDEEKNKILIELFHCKFSGENSSGARVSDLYELCGQAQKSIHWKDDPDLGSLFTHMLRREDDRMRKKGISRFEVGNEQQLYQIIEKSKVYPKEFKINIIQPGLSKSKVSQRQLELLGVTENYLMETYQISLFVVASA